MSRKQSKSPRGKSRVVNHNFENAETESEDEITNISKTAEDQDNSMNHSIDVSNHESFHSTGSPATRLRSRAGLDRKNISGSSPNSTLYPDLSSHFVDDSPKPSPIFSKKGTKSPKAAEEKLYPVVKDHVDESREGKASEVAEGSNCSTYLMVMILLIFVVSFIGYALLPWKVLEPEPASKLGSFERYIKGIDNLQQKFPQQSARLWRTLKASAQHSLNVTNPKYPVVVLMGANIQNHRVTECIAQKVAELYERSASDSGKVNDVGVSNVAEFKSLSASAQKKKLDTDMSSTFSEDKSKAFIISNLQLLAPEASLILHGYCDNDNAPFKDVLLLMTFYIDTDVMSFASISPKSSEEVEEHLRNLWSQGLEKDKVDALLSRVGNNIVILRNAGNNKVNAICP